MRIASIPGGAAMAAPSAAVPVRVGPEVAAPSSGSLRVAQMNLWNLFDTVDDPKHGDTILDPAQYEVKLAKTARAIVELGMPDVISVNEVENERALRDLVARPELKAAGYAFVMPPKNDERGINVGVLYRTSRLDVAKVEHPNPKMSFPDGGRGQLDRGLLYARLPLIVDFKVRGAAQAAEGAGVLTVAVNHFKSKLGGAAPEMRRQMQGQYLGEYLDARRAVNPNSVAIVLGDLNANYGEGAYEKLANRADGTKRLYDAPLKLSAGQRYTYVYRGQKDLLDHLMVSAGCEDAITGVDILRGGTTTTPANKAFVNDPSTYKGHSDHDAIVADFDLAKLFGPR